MSSASDIIDQLTIRIQESAPTLITQVTTDPTLIKPSVGKVSVWIEPPEYAWAGWDTVAPDVTFKLLLVAGTPDRQLPGLGLIEQAMDALHGNNVNMARAVPAGFDLNGRTLAAYEITLNPM